MNYGQNEKVRPDPERTPQSYPPDRREVRDPRAAGGPPKRRPQNVPQRPRGEGQRRPQPPPGQRRRPMGQAYASRPARRGGYYGQGRPGRSPKNGAAYAVIAVLLLVIVVSLVSIIRSCSSARHGDAADTASTSGGANTAASVPPETETVTGDYDQSISIVRGKENGKIRICVDAGHGYDDVGAQSPNLGSKNEEDINLAVAEKLVPLLTYEGYDVIMTRESDTPPSTLKPNKNGQYLIDPKWRSEFANRNDTDLYISLHCNSFDDTSASGIRLYYCSDSTYGSDEFASKLSAAMAGTFNIAAPKAIGMTTANAYVVTKLVNAPSVLVEMGFITNKTDAENLLSEEWQTQMARAVARGIKDYLSAE